MPAFPISANRVLILATAFFGGMLVSTSASAFFGSAGGNPRACAPYSDRFDVPGLWLGHFSGGRQAFHPNGDRKVDWANEYQCFFSARACHAWRAGMKRVYSRYQGYGTCLALRGGGTPIRYRTYGISARY